MDDLLHDLAESDVPRLAGAILDTGLFADTSQITALASAVPWRIQVTDRDEVALLRCHAHLPLLLIEGLFCEESRVATLVRAIAELGRAHECERLVSPVVDGPGSRAYERAGMHVDRRIAALELRGTRSELPASAHTVRVGGRSDTGDVLALDADAFEPFWRFDEEWMERSLPRARLSLVSEGRRLAGYALSRAEDRQGHIMRMGVHPLCRRRGVGTALLADALATMDAAGVHRVTVNTQADNNGAKALYRRAGFRESPAPLLLLISDML